MKRKNGFTFVELLAVITIIGVMSLIAAPTVERIAKENKEKIYQTQLDNIILALKNWASDNKELLPTKNNEVLTLTLGSLKADGYLEYELKNPKNNKCFDNDMILLITKEEKNYDYKIDLDTIKESDNCSMDEEIPIMVLNGSIVENVEVNSAYIDKGVVAYDKDGNDITSNVTKIISGNAANIDTSVVGKEYVISYSVTSNNKTAKTSRTVKIVDTIGPTIYAPNIIIGLDATELNLEDGVSATDNSKEDIMVTCTSHNLKFGVAGKYTATYTATDSSGNKTTQNRIITIK